MPRISALLLAALAMGIGSPSHGQPIRSDAQDIAVERSLRRTNTLLAQHQRLLWIGIAVTTLVVDGDDLITYFRDPNGMDGSGWRARASDLQSEVTERFTEGYGRTGRLPCREVGPIREEILGKCWMSREGLEVYGRLEYDAGPVASRAIRESVEQLIRLMQAREHARR